MYDCYALHSLGNTLFLDPLVLREWLPNIKEWSDSFNVRTLLLEQQYAVENPEVRYDSRQTVNP